MSSFPAMPDPSAGRVPLSLPSTFMGFGLIAGFLLLLSMAIHVETIEHVRLQAQLLSVVHLFTLGFGSAITLGALYQMAPVVLVTKLHSPALGYVSLATFLPGSALIVISFHFFFIPGLALGAGLVTAGTLFFVYNVGRTWIASRDFSLTRRFLLPSILSFFITIWIGFTIAMMWRFGFRLADRPIDLLGMHMFFGLVGWFTGVIIGVSYRLIGMFRLVHDHKERIGHLILALLYGGVVIGGIGTLIDGFQPSIVGIGLLLIVAAVLLYAVDFTRLWKNGARPPDVWMVQVPWAVGYLIVSIVAAALLFFSSVVTGTTIPTGLFLAVGTLFALGWVGTMIVALLHKIVPFLVWYHRYSSKVGKQSVPLMKDLVDERRGKMWFACYHAALIVAVPALAVGALTVAKVAFIVMTFAYGFLAYRLIVLLLPKHRRETAFAPDQQLS